MGQASGFSGSALIDKVLESLSEGCQVVDFEWRYVYLNDVAAQQGGRAKEELVGRTMMECYPGIDETPMFAVLRRCMSERVMQRLDNEFHFADGSSAWFELRFLPVSQGVCVLSLEITRWRQSEVRAKESEARYRQLADAMPQMVWSAGADGATDYCNARWTEYTGLTAAEAQGWGWESVIHSDDRAAVAAGWTAAFRGGDPYELRCRFKRASDGAHRWHLVRALPARDGEARIVKWYGTATDIDDHVAIEQALRASQGRFARLSDAGLIGIVVASLGSRVTEINDTLLRMVGYSREEIVQGQVPWHELSPPEWAEVDRRAVHELQSAGVASLREKEYLRKDGTRVPVLIGSAMLEDAGTTNETISFVLDLTERKKADAAMARVRAERASEAQFRELIEAAPDAVLISGDDDRIVLVNAQTERLFGHQRRELLGQPVTMLYGPQQDRIDEKCTVAHFRGRPELGSTPGFEIVALHQDGRMFPVEVTLSPLRREDGQVLILRHIRDISSRKATEERLRASEERFRLLVSNVRDYAILMLDRVGRVVSWNAGAERLLGYRGDAIIGQHFSRFYPTDETALDKLAAELAIAAADGRFEEEGIRVRQDGRRFVAHVVVTPIRDLQGELIGFAKVTRDVTERHRADAALELAHRELEAFSYSVAHDLRAPVRAMNGFAQLLLATHMPALDAEGQDWLQEIHQNAVRMSELIDALLGLSRVSRSDMRAEFVDLGELVRECVARHDAEKVGATEVVIARESPLLAHIDPRLARVLVENLVGNAWKFTRKTPSPRIELGVTSRDGDSIFFVRDNGAGFDMSLVRKLFTPFQRLHTHEEFAGIGVGLATVQRIVHRHGGRIWAEAAVGAGATFYFSLPTQPTDPTDAEEDPAPRGQLER